MSESETERESDDADAAGDMLDRAGIETGIDLDKMIATAKWLEREGLKHPVASALSKAGGFPQPARADI